VLPRPRKLQISIIYTVIIIAMFDVEMKPLLVFLKMILSCVFMQDQKKYEGLPGKKFT